MQICENKLPGPTPTKLDPSRTLSRSHWTPGELRQQSCTGKLRACRGPKGCACGSGGAGAGCRRSGRPTAKSRRSDSSASLRSAAHLAARARPSGGSRHRGPSGGVNCRADGAPGCKLSDDPPAEWLHLRKLPLTSYFDAFAVRDDRPLSRGTPAVGTPPRQLRVAEIHE